MRPKYFMFGMEVEKRLEDLSLTELENKVFG